MPKEIHIGVYQSDDAQTMNENINAQIRGGRHLLTMSFPINYNAFGYEVMRNLKPRELNGLETIAVRPGDYRGIGPSEPIIDLNLLLSIGEGMKRFRPEISIDVSSTPIIDLNPPTIRR